MTEKHRRRAKQGSVWKRRRNGRVQYVAQYDAPRGADGLRRRKTLVGSTYAEVVGKLKKLAREADAGRVAEPAQLTVANLVESFLASKAREIEPTTHAQYTHALKKHVNARLGGTRLRHLSPLDVQRFLASMDGDGVGPRAKREAFDLLAAVCAFGEDMNQLQSNPCARIGRPKCTRPAVVALSAAQAMHLLSVARDTAPDVGAVVALGLCGLRRGELFALQWQDIDLEAGIVQVRRALKQAGGKVYFAEPKTRAGRRVVPMAPWALAAVAALRASLLPATPLPHVLLFSSSEGTPIQFSNWARRVWVPLREKAKLPESVTLHCLRHTAASLLLGSGVDVRTVAGILGHEQPSLTLNVYASFIPNRAAEAMANYTLGSGA